MHGYELHRELRKKTGLGLVWTVKQAQLYAILAKLEARGLIEAELVDAGARPARKVFHLTEAGSAAYEEWVRTPASRRDFRLDFLAKLLAARKSGLEAAASLVGEQRRLCGLWLEEARARRAAVAEDSLDGLVHSYRIGQLEATAAWLDGCAARFASRRET
jgi:PadR family transcriptional regulator, regulatory protein AphA